MPKLPQFVVAALLVAATASALILRLPEAEAKATADRLLKLPVPAPASLRPDTPLPINLSATDHKLYRRAFEAASQGNFAAAMRIAAAGKNPLPRKVLHWHIYRQNGSDAPFAEITRFIHDNPEWPGMRRMRRQAERAIQPTTPDKSVLAWFNAYPPLTGIGRWRLAESLFRTGDVPAAATWIRKAWIEGDFYKSEEQALLRQHRARLDQGTHVARLDRLLWERKITAARRMFALLSSDHVALAKARIALIKSAPGVDAAVNRVPKTLQDDPGLMFERARWRRKRGLHNEARDLLLQNRPAHSSRPNRWWREVRIQVRKLLADDDFDGAYAAATTHRLTSGKDFAEAEFLAGWVALRFLQDADRAIVHFNRLLDIARFPITQARGAYWMARAHAAKGDEIEAQIFFAKASRNSTTYYGQLAAFHDAGDVPAHPTASVRPSAERRAAFEQRELVRVVRLLTELGETDNLPLFISRLSAQSKSAEEFVITAELANGAGLLRYAVGAAKRAARVGYFLPEFSYPEIEPINAVETDLERALLHAVARQESAFDARAISSAGARGLMQLMPFTAKQAARQLNDIYRRDLLLLNPDYNVRLGSHHLGDLLEYFDGSYLLAIAGYNAGRHRVNRWIETWGDPRSDDVDPIDWVELIPFTETRNYVQRVLENLQIYRQRAATSNRRLVDDLTGPSPTGKRSMNGQTLRPKDRAPSDT